MYIVADISIDVRHRRKLVVCYLWISHLW